MTSNDAVFDLARQVTFDVVVDTATTQAGNQAREIHKFVKVYNSRLYQEMARTGVLMSEKTPGFLLDNNPYGQPWARLSENYHDRKLREGYDGGFYRRKGDLARELFSRNSSYDFGKAEVSVSTQGSGINSAKYTVDSAGRPRFNKGSKDLAGRGIGGRYAPMSVFNSLTFTIQMQLFTGLTENVTPQLMKRIYPTSIGKKFGVGEFGRSSGKGGVQPARPLLRPFLHWYTTTNFRQRLYETFKFKV